MASRFRLTRLGAEWTPALNGGLRWKPGTDRLCRSSFAEDNPADVLLVRQALREQHIDCTLHVVEDGEKAIAFFESLDHETKAPRLDLVLLDIHLPKRDGEERSSNGFAPPEPMDSPPSL